MKDISQTIFNVFTDLRDGDYTEPNENVKNEILDYVTEINNAISSGIDSTKEVMDILEIIYEFHIYSKLYPEESKWIDQFIEKIYEKIWDGIQYYN